MRLAARLMTILALLAPVSAEARGALPPGFPAIEIDGVSEGLKVANDSIYGLAASVWTRDLTVAHKTVRDLEAGVIWGNCFDHGDMTQPFGGYKQSGQGRDKCVESLISYTQTKSAWINLG